MALNKKTVDDINAKGKRVLVRCDFNVPLKAGEITDDTRIKAALPTIKKLLNDGGKVILCSHLGKVKNGPNEGESLAPVAKRLEELLGQKVNFVSDYNVTGEAATKAVEEMKEGEVVLLQNTRFRGAEETKNGEQFSKELADLADIYVCDAFGSSHRAHASVAGVTKFITAKGGENVVGYLMQKEIDFLGNAVNNPERPFVAILGGAKVSSKISVIENLLDKVDTLIIGGGTISYYLAKALSDLKISVKIIDKNKERCEELSEMLPNATIICGDGTDRALLMEEGLSTVESFVTLTNMDEENIFLSLSAKNMTQAKLIAKVNRLPYKDVIDELDIGSVIYPKYITSDSILRYVRAMQNTIGSNVETLYHVLDNQAEALEFIIRDNSPVVGIPLSKLNLKNNLLVCCLTREGTVRIPRGQDSIQIGDNVIIVTTHKGLRDIRDILA